MKRCGFVIRVSTDIQARNPEGSLTNQLQRLKAHVEYKNVACRENWVEAEKYILKGVSGKNSFKSPEFARLFNDIKLGKINTIICTALDRISRSVKDFLNFFEILTKYNVEFLSNQRDYMGDIIEKTNHKMRKELPQLKQQKDLLQKELEEAKNSADKIMNKWLSSPGDNGSAFIKDKLEELGKTCALGYQTGCPAWSPKA